MDIPRLTARCLARVRLTFALRPVVYWGVVVALALLAALVVQAGLARGERAWAAWGRRADVLVALHHLRPGDVLDATAAELRSLPVALVPPGAVDEPSDGRVVAAPIAAGEIVHRVRLGRAGATGAAALLPEGTVGLAVPVPEGFAAAVGDLVDVVGVLDGAVLAREAPVVSVTEQAAMVGVPREALTALAAAQAQGGVFVVLAG